MSYLNTISRRCVNVPLAIDLDTIRDTSVDIGNHSLVDELLGFLINIKSRAIDEERAFDENSWETLHKSTRT